MQKFEPLANAQTGYYAIVLTLALLFFRANGLRASLWECFIPLAIALALGVIDLIRLMIMRRQE